MLEAYLKSTEVKEPYLKYKKNHSKKVKKPCL